MSHSHSNSHAVDNIRIAFFLNLSFTLLEIFGGLFTNSMAILADALHDFGDSIALGLSWYFAHLSERGRDTHFSYGYKRFSLLGALITSIILIFGSILILFNAIPRILHPESVHVGGMVGFAILGVIVNGIAVMRLHQGKTQNERMAMLHLLEDVLGWVVVLIASIVMLFADLPWLDPLLSVGITGYILWNVLGNFKETLRIFLQATPEHINSVALEKLLLQQLPIESIHDWHVWTMDGEYHVLSLHVVVADTMTVEATIQLKQQIREMLHQNDIEHATIEIEYAREKCEWDHH
jgi:cobalt-zinc-cadmium efflux system protein